jgi:glycosyltransferase involved in cell wall biosynthesis
LSIRIVHLITGLDVGGAETMMVRLLPRMDRHRFEHHVVTLLTPGVLAGPLRTAGIPVSTLAMRRGRPSPAAVLRLVAILRRLRPSILQTWLYHADVLGTLANAIARVPALVWNVRASDVDMTHYRRLSGLTRRMGARWSARPQAVIVNSTAGLRAHERLHYRPRRWVVIPNGVDVQQFRADPAARTRIRAELGVPDSSILIGLVARFDPMKDHDTFLRAAQIVAGESPDVHFLLAGAGVDAGNPSLRAAIDAGGLHGRVSLLGARQDIAAVDAALDVAVMASAFGEGFPNAVAEAMACSVPCVVTDVGDAATLVGSTGWVVPPRDVAGMAQAFRACIAASPDDRRRRGRDARHRVVSEYSLERVTQLYESFYGSVGRAS